MSDQELRERVNDLTQVYWHHTIRLLPDVVTNGAKTAAMLEAERAAILGVIDLADRSVVDVGSWNGYFAFEARKAGASRVIATDSYCWRHPGFRGRETFELARECLGIDVEAKEIDPTEFPGDMAPVDVVLFLGVFYHMIDPIMVLRKVASLATDLLVIETHVDLLTLGRPAMVLYPGATLNNDASNWWGPNPECVAELLATVEFPHVFYQRHPEDADRGIFHAFRSGETARRYLRRPADNVTLFDLRSDLGRRAVFQPLSAASGGALAEQTAAEMLKKAVAERNAALAEVAALRGSTSWALTSPVRALSWLIRRR
jgi:tRNA (mo5U34)-methyltransferase